MSYIYIQLKKTFFIEKKKFFKLYNNRKFSMSKEETNTCRIFQTSKFKPAQSCLLIQRFSWALLLSSISYANAREYARNETKIAKARLRDLVFAKFQVYSVQEEYLRPLSLIFNIFYIYSSNDIHISQHKHTRKRLCDLHVVQRKFSFYNNQY